MVSRSPPRKPMLQLPPELDENSTPENTTSSVKLLLHRALEKLSKLGPVEDLKPRNVVGRGERDGDCVTWNIDWRSEVGVDFAATLCSPNDTALL